MNLKTDKLPHISIALIPLLFLIFLLAANIIIFKDQATQGPNQLALLISAALATFLGTHISKKNYKDIEEIVIKSVSSSLHACIILLIVGSLIGVWMLSGIVPAMIYYGLELIHPIVFLPIACIVCCIVALATGSSWSTTGTIGVALIAIGQTLGIPIGMVAGAIISGAYFGDKMSPLSDTTNLAPAMAGTDIMTHIRHMTYTSGPAIILSIIGFFILGIFNNSSGNVDIALVKQMMIVLNQNFSIGIHLFLVPLVVIFLVAKKTPAIPSLVVGVLLGIVFALLFQQKLILSLTGENTFNFKSVYHILTKVSFDGLSIKTSNSMLNSLLNRGGMSSMLNTVWLIICAMIFGGAMEATGKLDALANVILKMVHKTGHLIGATLGSCIMMNMVACDQYLAIVVPGRMFRKAYADFGLEPKYLSRSLEDAGTVTSVLVPWNSGGAYNSGVLGVATLTYLPYCFFNILSPLISILIGTIGQSFKEKLALKNNSF